ncbi:hypothetical protein HC725_16150 [Vibrio sp. S17_S38]|uniref:Uncharacterized protein n=1 Tax=Vibrio tasmaniensis TaxID=212663 RepID=A0A0H3ZJX5_9VIBR|nr:hypothetical protein [Vibrio sp. S17_S38]AKN36298.1 hypothetical protein [Vibrio tasmaniensis]MBD1574782.1 hypothetical protein [Vibrio sp. S17_S38]
MVFNEEKYDKILDKLSSEDFTDLNRLAYQAGIRDLIDETETISGIARKALDYTFDDNTKLHLENLHEKVDVLSMEVSGLIDTLEKINDQLDEAEQVLLENIYDDDEWD